MRRNKVFTLCAKVWSVEVLSDGPGFWLFEPHFFLPVILEWISMIELKQKFSKKTDL